MLAKKYPIFPVDFKICEMCDTIYLNSNTINIQPILCMYNEDTITCPTCSSSICNKNSPCQNYSCPNCKCCGVDHCYDIDILKNSNKRHYSICDKLKRRVTILSEINS